MGVNSQLANAQAQMHTETVGSTQKLAESQNSFECVISLIHFFFSHEQGHGRASIGQQAW